MRFDLYFERCFDLSGFALNLTGGFDLAQEICLKKLNSLKIFGRKICFHIASKTPLSCFDEVLRLFLVDTLGDAFTSAELIDAIIPTQHVQNDADLLCECRPARHKTPMELGAQRGIRRRF